jgi:hypothetical protein
MGSRLGRGKGATWKSVGSAIAAAATNVGAAARPAALPPRRLLVASNSALTACRSRSPGRGRARGHDLLAARLIGVRASA